MKDFFRRFSHKSSDAVGSPWAFIMALFVIIVWAATGPIFKFSDTWQLVINTSTTIITFLMVFLIQNAQNRDSKAIHLKIDEIIFSNQGARNDLIDLEDCTDEEILIFQKEFLELKKKLRNTKKE
ncbi:MAG: low affinity iron permease family protein [Candidatus Sericytochromatia bacterium]|nr:low affinity iron permease family protein [Candidatus Sericytochromatia bacterium]